MAADPPPAEVPALVDRVILVNPATSFNSSPWPLLGPLLPQASQGMPSALDLLCTLAVAMLCRAAKRRPAVSVPQWCSQPPLLRCGDRGRRCVGATDAAAGSTSHPGHLPVAWSRCRQSCTVRCLWPWPPCWPTQSTCWRGAWRAGGVPARPGRQGVRWWERHSTMHVADEHCLA